jgi:hypothetical protein
MERVMFLIEGSEERIACLLNPESLEIRRRAGIQPRRLANGVLGGAGLVDDPLLCTGGGSTELRLDLLFDVSVAGSSHASECGTTPARSGAWLNTTPAANARSCRWCASSGARAGTSPG